MINTGEPCHRCRNGYYVVLDSLVKGTRRVQYLGCRKCGYRPEGNKRVLPAEAPTPRFVKKTS